MKGFLGGAHWDEPRLESESAKTRIPECRLPKVRPVECHAIVVSRQRVVQQAVIGAKDRKFPHGFVRGEEKIAPCVKARELRFGGEKFFQGRGSQPLEPRCECVSSPCYDRTKSVSEGGSRGKRFRKIFT